MDQQYHLAGINVGAPSVTTRNDGTTVRVTATAILVRHRGPRTSPEATVVIGDDDAGLPGERLEAQDLKALVTKAIDRAVVEARASAAAFIEAIASEPPAPTFDAAALRAAYRLGHDRGTYDAGGDPSAVDPDSPAFRFGEAHDLKAYLGSEGSDMAFGEFIATQGTGTPAAA